MNNYSFGNYICSLREKKGLSQSELGEKLGVSNKAVSKWENGGAYPSTELMLPLAEALGVTIEELYQAVTESKKKKTKKRLFLEWIAAHARPLTLALLAYAVVPTVLYAIFMEAGEEKTSVLIGACVSSLLFYVFVRFGVPLILKNPWAPVNMVDGYLVFFFGVVGAALCFTLLSFLAFILYFPVVYSPSIPAFAFISIGFIGILKKRYAP